MSKTQSIISSLDTNIPQKLPQISHIFETDLQIISLALKKQKDDKSYYAILRYLLSQVKRKLNHKNYSQPLLEISLAPLQGKPYINQLKLKICEAIIQCQQFYRVNLVQNILNQLQQQQISDWIFRARIQICYAGKQYLKGSYLRASIFYFQASKQQAFLKQQDKKLQLINKSIAFCYISPINNQRHKHICALCLNQFAKKSQLRGILQKMYVQDIITQEDCSIMIKYFPESIRNSNQSSKLQIENEQNIESIPILKRSKFEHNMLIIMNSFTSISFNTLSNFLGIQINQILILLEITYKQNQFKIDQEQQYVYFNQKYQNQKERVKSFFQKIDQIIFNEDVNQ